MLVQMYMIFDDAFEVCVIVKTVVEVVHDIAAKGPEAQATVQVGATA